MDWRDAVGQKWSSGSDCEVAVLHQHAKANTVDTFTMTCQVHNLDTDRTEAAYLEIAAWPTRK